MTCGFFILGVPCIPCLVKTSGLRGKCGSFFGVSLGSSNNRSAAHRERSPTSMMYTAISTRRKLIYHCILLIAQSCRDKVWEMA
ncbi:hypothetical protein E4T50_03932 [Aureobasidium sp. EXF-12298]|nr:hypothetical protein E4T50_03932 [Aureobasidium sp. EXF-12298]KAI4763648.1 hypothetical protein E4T51_03344 [Aureobasidium sp. EXF-12344]KAI4780682.1 hypothetical protein E4T52_04391 [Aureobasidium sp. EXF-3400]